MEETASWQEAEGKRKDTYGDKRITYKQSQGIWESKNYQ